MKLLLILATGAVTILFLSAVITTALLRQTQIFFDQNR